MKRSLLTMTSLSVLGGLMLSPALAQDKTPSLNAASDITQYAQVRDMRQLQARPTTYNVMRDYRSLRCEKGEEKKLILKGRQDNFASSGSEPASRSGRMLANSGYSTYPFASTYDDPRVNVHFADHLDVPSDTTRGFIAFGLKTNGSNLDTNDNVTIGDLSAGQTPGSQRLFAHRVNTLGAPFTNSGGNYRANLSAVNLRASGETLLSLIQAGSGTSEVDFHIQDDHSVDYVAIGVCVGKPKPASDAVLTTDGCAGKEVKIDTKYGPGAIREYCYGDPITFSTAGTVSDNNYHVGLQTFDPVNWQGLNQIHPGAWTCNNGTCPPPAHLMPASYNNPAGQPLAPNAPGEVYMFSYAVGPTWDSEMIMFRVVACKDKPNVVIDRETAKTPAGRMKMGPARIQKR